MTRDELRAHMVASIDKVLASWIVSRYLTDLDKAVLRAQRQLCLTSDKYVDDLLALLGPTPPKRESAADSLTAEEPKGK